MSKKPRARRPYDSPTRRKQAATTRQKLVGSARRLFAAHGYVTTTIPAIAAAAGVSVQTFYATFGSKRGVLFALHESVIAQADRGRLDAELHASADPRRQLRSIIAFVVRFHRHAADLIEIVRAAGTADPDAAALWREGEGRRFMAQAPIVKGWAARGALADGLTEARALSVLWALTGGDGYRLFVEERGWTLDEYERWLNEALDRLLLR